MPPRRPRAPVELPARPELDRGGQQEHEREEARVVERPGDEHRRHQDRADRETDAELQAQIADFARPLLGRVVAVVARVGPLLGDAVAGLLDRRAEVGDGGGTRVVGDRRALGGEIDGDRLDARHLAQRPLDPPHAGGAGHPGHGQHHLLAAHPVAGLLDGRLQVGEGGGGRVVADGGLLGRQVDAGVGHARHLGERPLDAAHAGGAGHAGDRQADVLGRPAARRGGRR